MNGTHVLEVTDTKGEAISGWVWSALKSRRNAAAWKHRDGEHSTAWRSVAKADRLQPYWIVLVWIMTAQPAEQ